MARHVGTALRGLKDAANRSVVELTARMERAGCLRMSRVRGQASEERCVAVPLPPPPGDHPGTLWRWRLEELASTSQSLARLCPASYACLREEQTFAYMARAEASGDEAEYEARNWLVEVWAVANDCKHVRLTPSGASRTCVPRRSR